MDAATQEVWLLLHFLDADPNNQYEIVSGQHIINKEGTRHVRRGALVQLKHGAVQGIVVSINDKYEKLSKNSNSLIEEFEEFKLDAKNLREQHELRRRKKIEANYIQTIITLRDKEETQPDDVEMVTKTEHEALKLQYEALLKKHEEFQAAVLEVENIFSELTLKANNKEVAKGERPKAKVSSLEDIENNERMVVLGEGGTEIPSRIYESIKWQHHTAATRTLLITCFAREVLASHSMTGKPSPALVARGKQAKQRLNPVIVDDIVETVVRNCGVSRSTVRGSITSKCADENKLLKRQNVQKKIAAKKLPKRLGQKVAAKKLPKRLGQKK